MSLLSVLKYPDPKLKIIAMPVEHISPITRQFIKDMITTMYGTSSVGLTATQVGVHQRIAVIDVPESLVQPIVLINPVIAESKEEKNITEEKCLSIPGTSRFVYRAEKINVSALDAFGNTINFSASGTLSICIQHMIDHMNGILLTKSLSQ